MQQGPIFMCVCLVKALRLPMWYQVPKRVAVCVLWEKTRQRELVSTKVSTEVNTSVFTKVSTEVSTEVHTSVFIKVSTEVSPEVHTSVFYPG